MSLTPSLLTLARKHEQKLAADYAAHLADCESDRREGHRPHYCEHGTNQWTDYDNICGPCENSWTMSDGVQRREYAIWLAKAAQAKIARIMNAVAELRGLGVPVDIDAACERVSALCTV
jgi:hypothetical protein